MIGAIQVIITRISCMALGIRNGVPTGQKCKRPVQYVFEGEDGPFYRCGKCGNALMNMRDDIEVVEYV